MFVGVSVGHLRVLSWHSEPHVRVKLYVCVCELYVDLCISVRDTACVLHVMLIHVKHAHTRLMRLECVLCLFVYLSIHARTQHIVSACFASALALHCTDVFKGC